MRRSAQQSKRALRRRLPKADVVGRVGSNLLPTRPVASGRAAICCRAIIGQLSHAVPQKPHALGFTRTSECGLHVNRFHTGGAQRNRVSCHLCAIHCQGAVTGAFNCDVIPDPAEHARDVQMRELFG